MPVHLPPISRRRFLTGTLAAGVAALLPRQLWADEGSDPNHFLLLADTHVCEGRSTAHRSIKPVLAFEQFSRHVLAIDGRPSAAVIAGDCAFRVGMPGDYRMLASLVRPLLRKRLSVHMALGNHDHREHFMEAFPEAKSLGGQLLPNKLVSVLESPHANWFLLDSLDKTNVTPGLLGQTQLAWLARELDARPGKPALVLGHHNPDLIGTSLALTDTTALMKVLLSRRQVKAYLFGHTHQWHHAEYKGLHLVNLPAVAWVFDQRQPRGFVSAKLGANGATLQLHAFDPKHAKHGETVDVRWSATPLSS